MYYSVQIQSEITFAKQYEKIYNSARKQLKFPENCCKEKIKIAAET